MPKSPDHPFAERYENALRQHLRRRPRGVQTSRAGRALGHEAVILGLDAFSLSRLHDQAVSVIAQTHTVSFKSATADTLSPFGVFFLEVLRPIEHAREIRAPDRVSRGPKPTARGRNRVHQILLDDETERIDCSREMREEIIQILAGTHLHLAALSAADEASEARRQTTIARTQQLLNLSVSALHRLARRLHPAMLDTLGLVPALRALVAELSQRGKLKIDFSTSLETETLTPLQRTVLYRIAQKVLDRGSPQDHPTTAWVTLAASPRSLVLEIRDNGRSFTASNRPDSASSPGFGLQSMRERIKMVGGRFTLESTPGEGTCVRAEIPWSSNPSPSVL